MAALTLASRLSADGSFTLPQEALERLGLHPGDEITVRIETKSSADADALDQAELQRRAALRFNEADQLVREPGKPLSDPLEATWAVGVEEKARRMGLKL